MGKSFGIISLKGGVGKTSVVTSLGAAISDFNKKVLLVDGNLSSPNLGMHLDIINPEITLHDVLNREANVEDAIIKQNFFDVLPSSMISKSKVNPFQLRDKIRALKKIYDVILIDSSPSFDEETMAVMLASDGILLITTPDLPTLSTTIKAIKQSRKRGIPVIGMILNKVYGKKFEIPLKDIEELAEVPVLALIPYDINNLKALSEFTPSTFYIPRSKGSIEYRKLGAVLIGEKYKPRLFKEFFKLSPKAQDVNREIFYERFFG